MLLRKDVFFLEDEYVKSFDNIKKGLLKTTETTLRLAKPGQQHVNLRDAGYYSSGIVLWTEDYLKQTDGENKHTHLYFADHTYLMQVN